MAEIVTRREELAPRAPATSAAAERERAGQGRLSGNDADERVLRNGDMRGSKWRHCTVCGGRGAMLYCPAEGCPSGLWCRSRKAVCLNRAPRVRIPPLPPGMSSAWRAGTMPLAMFLSLPLRRSPIEA